jgi:hypothetical protein
MIVSASYKTDIPAFYGEWFMNRLRAGYCRCINPYSKRAFTVSLRSQNVDGIVFWTKNIGPFLCHLNEVERSFPFYIQYSINGYPRALESSVIDKQKSIDNLWQIRSKYGLYSTVWRYDPVVFSSITPYNFHIENFSEIAEKLTGAVNEVVISFAQVYAKTERNLNAAVKKLRFSWTDPAPAEKFALASRMAQIAASCGIQLTVCSQKDFVVPGAREARCIDIERLSKIANRLVVAELKGNRPECGCYASKDIGDYDTCPHGCIYCYAVQNRLLARKRYSQHDPQSEFLFDSEEINPNESGNGTLPLF